MKNDELKMIDIEFKSEPDPSAPSRLAHQFESMAVASRSMEAMLNKERTYSRQLREYTQNILTRVNHLEKHEKELLDKLKELENSSQKCVSMEKELTETQAELKRYQDAWAQVLEREKKAQQLIVRAGTADRKILELEGALAVIEEKYSFEKESREKCEQSLAVHREELQTTVLRLQSSEARYMDITRELEAMYALRKNHAAEIARIEAQARERSATEFFQEKSQIEREFKHQRDLMEAEITRLRQEMADANSEYYKINEQLSRELEQARVENQKLKLDWETYYSNEKARWEHESKAASDQRTAELESQFQVQLQTEVQSQVAAVQEKLKVEHEAALAAAVAHAESAAASQAQMASASADQTENERKLGAYRDQNEALVQLIEQNQKHLREMLGKVIEVWGELDPALGGALKAIQETCQTSSLSSDPVPPKSGWPTERVVIRGSGPKLNC